MRGTGRLGLRRTSSLSSRRSTMKMRMLWPSPPHAALLSLASTFAPSDKPCHERGVHSRYPRVPSPTHALLSPPVHPMPRSTAEYLPLDRFGSGALCATYGAALRFAPTTRLVPHANDDTPSRANDLPRANTPNDTTRARIDLDVPSPTHTGGTVVRLRGT
ncbi:hypothetical protein MSAN_01956100 [Mycena sanguinolenta]|uniref:Uncharacterized protein n=1 Tax=Mycena sanguinolenta TaxID=230812 RepID=A0A8H6XNC7_9AGAR|nr:hypothetical protein MSAN_01956100 [Mycena sanguinolenta]